MNWLLPPLEPHFDAALRDVQARTPQARVAAATRLGRPEAGREREAEQGLLALAADALPSVRGAALRSLADVGTPSAHGPVRACLRDADPWVRELAVIALASIEHPDRPAALLQALEHSAPEVRFQALGACAEVCPERALQAILKGSLDDDSRIREAAVRALGQLDRADGRIIARLRALLDDSAGKVRFEAALLLASTGDPDARPGLLAGIADPELRLDAVDALASYTDAQARDAVYALGRRVLVSPIVNAAAGRSLLRMGDRARALECLRDALGAVRPEGRNHVLETIRDEDVPELAPELLRLSTRPRGADLCALARACARIADRRPEARTALARLAGRKGPAGALASALLDQQK